MTSSLKYLDEHVVFLAVSMGTAPALPCLVSDRSLAAIAHALAAKSLALALLSSAAAAKHVL